MQVYIIVIKFIEYMIFKQKLNTYFFLKKYLLITSPNHSINISTSTLDI